jgi:hypothetical protein
VAHVIRTFGSRRKRDEVFVIEKIVFDKESTAPAHVLAESATLEGYFFQEVKSAFDDPFDSRRIGTFRARKLNRSKQVIHFTDVAGKFVLTHMDLSKTADPLNFEDSLQQIWTATLFQHL